MGRNLAQTRGLVFSQRILMALLRGGMGREQAYRIVQAISMRAWSTGAALEDEALADASLAEHLSVSQIRECFDLRHAFRNIGVVFERVFGQPAPSLELP
jgi:adenylosuccinate lyase